MRLNFTLPLIVSALVAVTFVNAAPLARAQLQRRAGPSSSHGVNTQPSDWLEEYQALEAKETPQIFTGNNLLTGKLEDMNQHIFDWRTLRSHVRFDQSFHTNLSPWERAIFNGKFTDWGSPRFQEYAVRGPPSNPHEIQRIWMDYENDANKVKVSKRLIRNYLNRLGI